MRHGRHFVGTTTNSEMSGCNGKVKHRSYQDAKAAAIRKRRFGKRKVNRDRGGAEKFGGKLNIYKCSVTEPTHWHIGKTNRIVPRPYKRGVT